MNKEEKIQELLTRGVEEVIDKRHLEAQLKSGKKLKVKLGIDPTSPNIHLGRAVLLRKLKAFQDLGHEVMFLVGDFTGLIGDTSDKDSERPMLDEATIKKNLKTYFDQAFLILDKKKTKLFYNSSWLKKLGFAEIGRMADVFGLHEFEARENIARRMKAGKRVSLRELLYPIMQGYDSVAMKADVELGGSDQRFNLLAGRPIQKLYGQQPQDILTMTLMEGTDGRKMSSSWGNVINLTDSPNEMYRKVMSIEDKLIEKYFILSTEVPMKDIKRLVKDASHYDQKKQLALEITKLYHGQKAAEAAEKNFTQTVSKGELPEHIDSLKVPADNYKLSDLLVTARLVSSKSEARRLIQQKGIKLNQKSVADDETIQIKEKGNNLLLQVGKRKFLTIL